MHVEAEAVLHLNVTGSSLAEDELRTLFAKKNALDVKGVKLSYGGLAEAEGTSSVSSCQLQTFTSDLPDPQEEP